MVPYASLEALYDAFVSAGMKVCTDTRRIEKGSLFVALKGPNFNANTFAASALAAGCSAAIVDDPEAASQTGTMLVPDGLKALQQLANHHRLQMNIPVIAITGSNAKTTSKELITAVLSRSYRCLSTTGNLNNHVGVPLTLLQLRSDHTIAVIEMGANHQGEIHDLCGIAAPTHGLITNIGRAHLEGFGGPEGVKKGKGELFRYLEKHGGAAFVNGDDPVVSELAGSVTRITYGSGKLYDVIGKDCTTSDTVSLRFTTRYGEKKWDDLPVVHTKMVGRYNYVNCLAAICVGVHFKVPAKEIALALESYVPAMNRSQLLNTGKNTVILDAYNANPDSMKAAIENFAAFESPKKIAVLGDMYELGSFSGDEHSRVVEMLREKGLREACLVGDQFSATSHNGYKSFTTTAACRDYLEGLRLTGYTVLLKGSRAMKMETLTEVL